MKNRVWIWSLLGILYYEMKWIVVTTANLKRKIVITTHAMKIFCAYQLVEKFRRVWFEEETLEISVSLEEEK